jgi:uncharacterized protein (DUF1015 family)
VVERRRLCGLRLAQIVVTRNGVEELGRSARAFEQAQAEMHVAEQLAVLGRAERRPGAQFDRATDVVDERGSEQQVRTQARMQLRQLAADRRNANRVLEQAAGVRMMPFGCGRIRPKRRTGEDPARRLREARVLDLGDQELEKALQLVGVTPHGRRERRRVCVGGFDRAHLELQLVAELLHPAEDANRIAFREPGVQQLDVVPHAGRDAARWIDELEREVRRAALCPQLLLPRDRVDAVDDSVLGELGDGAHTATLRYGPAVAEVRQFRAERYGEAAGPLEELVAPPYDVITPEQRLEYLVRSPHNVVHLTLPDSEEQAATLLRKWRDEQILVRDEPSAWALSQSYTGPDGVSRTRNGLVASLRVEPYGKRIVLPHERTHAGPKEGRLRLLRATRTQLEPIFLLHDGPRAEIPDREADLHIGGDRLWRVDATPDFTDLQLLIADGHHRYETAVAFHDEDGTDASAWMMVVLVSTQEEGLTIFPTHRVAQSVNGVSGSPIDEPGEELPGVVLYRGHGRYELVEGDGLDVDIVDALQPQGVTYTAQREDAVAAVDRGEAEAAFLIRPTRIEDVFERARRGEVMPQKTTYFFPKLTSGLLFHPVD